MKKNNNRINRKRKKTRKFFCFVFFKRKKERKRKKKKERLKIKAQKQKNKNKKQINKTVQMTSFIAQRESQCQNLGLRPLVLTEDRRAYVAADWEVQIATVQLLRTGTRVFGGRCAGGSVARADFP